MSRVLLLPSLFLAAILVSIFTGWRFGNASGEAAVTARIQQAESLVTRNAISAQSITADENSNRPRSREELRRFLEALRGKAYEQRVHADVMTFGLNKAASDELEKLSVEEIKTALEIVAEFPPGGERVFLTAGLLKCWADDDPAAASAWALSNRAEAGPFAGALTAITFPEWAKKDPRAAAAALTAAIKTDDDVIARLAMENTVFMVAEKLVEADLPAALRMAAEAPDWAKDSVRSAAAKQVHGTGREALFNAVKALPEGEEKTRWQSETALALLRTGEAETARQWLDSQPVSPENAEKITRGVFKEWIISDPARAVAWTMALLPETEHPALLRETVEQWAEREPNACGRWLSTLPPGPQNDPALAAFVEKIAGRDAESARAWAEKITEPALRQKALSGISTPGDSDKEAE